MSTTLPTIRVRKADPTQRARLLKAMAHPSRLIMIEELSLGERCVCQLTELVGADISTVSKHLSVLKEVGIVQDEKRGLQVWYSLRTPCVLQFFDCIDQACATPPRPTLGRRRQRP